MPLFVIVRVLSMPVFYILSTPLRILFISTDLATVALAMQLSLVTFKLFNSFFFTAYGTTSCNHSNLPKQKSRFCGLSISPRIW